MILFKVIHKDYLKTWHDYEKTSSFTKGARWNSAGMPVMYTSSNPQNAMLEIANYTQNPKQANKLFVMAVFEFPSSMKLHKIEPRELPSTWNDTVKKPAAQRLGDYYLDSDYDGIIVPSAAINAGIATNPSNAIREASYANHVLNLESIGIENIKKLEEHSPIFSNSMFI